MFGFGGPGELEILPQELKDRMDRGEEIVIIDVREDWEHARVHIPDTKHIPLNRLPNEIGVLDKTQDIVVYCHHGTRSMQACQYLQRMGFQKIKNLRGGIDAYAKIVDPSMPRY